jgi:hypothetical protein
LDPAHPDVICSSPIPNLSSSVLLAASGFLYGGLSLIYCGGIVSSGTTNKCYQLVSNTWIEMSASLNGNRAFATSADVTIGGKEYGIIVGGNNGASSNYGIGSVTAFEGNYWNDSIILSLPHVTSDHCMVKLDENTLFVLGGILDNNNGPTKTTFFCNLISNQWTPGN